MIKDHLFCVGAEVRPNPEGALGGTFIGARVNVYTGADELREALERAEAALRDHGYEITFVRGCWVVDAACDDGFCPDDALPTEIRGELVFSDDVHIGELRGVLTASDGGY